MRKSSIYMAKILASRPLLYRWQLFFEYSPPKCSRNICYPFGISDFTSHYPIVSVAPRHITDCSQWLQIMSPNWCQWLQIILTNWCQWVYSIIGSHWCHLDDIIWSPWSQLGEIMWTHWHQFGKMIWSQRHQLGDDDYEGTIFFSLL